LGEGIEAALKSAAFVVVVKRSGAGDRDRTGDIQLGKLTFCH
jgi:hypothetical protein